MFLLGDSLTWLRQINDESVNTVITSPPYWALRDYKVEGQVGLESSFQQYVARLIEIFDQVKRVLTKDGSCWVVLGDTYTGTGNKGEWTDPKYDQGRNGQVVALNNKVEGIKDKSLCQIPQRFAIAMIDRGWILRNDIIWHKRNCMPSSAKDRFTIDYEHVLFFVKSKKYYFKTQYEPYSEATVAEFGQKYTGQGLKEYDDNHVQNPSDVKRRIIASLGKTKDYNSKYNDESINATKRTETMQADRSRSRELAAQFFPDDKATQQKFINFVHDHGGTLKMPPIGGTKLAGGDNRTYSGNTPPFQFGRIMRSTWTINTKPFKEAHFAVFPPALVERMIDAGCPQHICDKCGKPWTMMVTETRVNTRPGNDVLNGKSGGQDDPNSELHKSDLSKYRQQIIRNEDGLVECSCAAPTHAGLVLDPFMGAGTTALIAQRMGRRWLGIELNPSYIEIARKRLTSAS